MSIADRLESLPFSGFHYRLLLLGGLGYCFDGLDGAILAFVMPALQHLWGLSTTQLGLLGSAAFLGYFIGALAAGVLADRYGRRPVMMWALACYCVGSFVSAFCMSWHSFVLCRIIAGAGTGAESAIIAPYLSEFVSKKYRGAFTGALAGFFSFGFLAAAVLGYLIIPGSETGWRTALVLTSCPVVMLLWWRRALPESPRWLAKAGHYAQAHTVLCKIEAALGRASSAMPDRAETPEVKPSMVGQLASLGQKNLLKITLIIWCLWLSVTFSYYAFFSWVPTLLMARGFTMAHSFAFSIAICAAQIPGYFIAAFCNEKLGRKTTLVAFLCAGVLSAFGLAASATPSAILSAGMLLSFFMNGVYASVYAYTPEVFPTEIRATATGAASAVGRLGAIIAPFVIGALYPRAGFPGVFSLIATILLLGTAFIIFFGPKTTNRALEEITQDYG